MTTSRLHLLLLTPLLALALVLGTGCGGGSDSSSNSTTVSEADQQLAEQAAKKAEQAADRVVQATRDKNLPGPKNYKSVCVRRGEPGAGPEVPPNAIRCHVEAFYGTYRGEPGGYIWSEDWLVPIQDGKLGTAVIQGAYRIQNFLREDNKRNCTGRHRPALCLPQSAGGVLPG
jgi:hypothetical protein